MENVFAETQSKFRRAANYIYKNTNWTEEERIRAIKSYIELSMFFPGQDKIDDIERIPDAMVKNWNGTLDHDVEQRNPEVEPLPKALKNCDVYRFTVTNDEWGTQENFVALDTKNNSWARQGKYGDIPNETNGTIKSYVLQGNLNYTLGFGKMFADVKQDWAKKFPGLDDYRHLPMNDELMKMFWGLAHKQNNTRELEQSWSLKMKDANNPMALVSPEEFEKYTRPFSQELTGFRLVKSGAPQQVKDVFDKFGSNSFRVNEYGDRPGDNTVIELPNNLKGLHYMDFGLGSYGTTEARAFFNFVDQKLAQERQRYLTRTKGAKKLERPAMPSRDRSSQQRRPRQMRTRHER